MATAGTLQDPQSVKIGSTSLTGVQSISFDESRNVIPSPAADGESFTGIPHLGSGGCSGSINFSNPVLARAAAGLSGTLTATVKGSGGQSDATLTIANVQCGGASSSVSKDAAGGGQVPFAAGSTDGTTSPVTLT